MQTFGIFVSAFMSMCLFKLRYLNLHYLGMIIGVLGMLVAVWPDLMNPESNYKTRNLLGDLLAIFSAISYSVEVVLQ